MALVQKAVQQGSAKRASKVQHSTGEACTQIPSNKFMACYTVHAGIGSGAYLQREGKEAVRHAMQVAVHTLPSTSRISAAQGNINISSLAEIDMDLRSLYMWATIGRNRRLKVQLTRRRR